MGIIRAAALSWVRRRFLPVSLQFTHFRSSTGTTTGTKDSAGRARGVAGNGRRPRGVESLLTAGDCVLEDFGHQGAPVCDRLERASLLELREVESRAFRSEGTHAVGEPGSALGAVREGDDLVDQEGDRGETNETSASWWRDSCALRSRRSGPAEMVVCEFTESRGTVTVSEDLFGRRGHGLHARSVRLHAPAATWPHCLRSSKVERIASASSGSTSGVKCTRHADRGAFTSTTVRS